MGLITEISLQIKLSSTSTLIIVETTNQMKPNQVKGWSLKRVENQCTRGKNLSEQS